MTEPKGSLASRDDRRLSGGFDHGAVRRGDSVLRTAGAWTPSVHHLLGHLRDRGFAGAPAPIRHTDAVDELEYLAGETVGAQRPWPGWVHSDQALRQVADWLSRYHRAVADYRPPPDAVWRESHPAPGPDMIVAHNDAAPYNAVWAENQLVGFVDWDMAGPRHRLDDVAWMAFSWVPLHARQVVSAEGFTEFERRRERLQLFLDAYDDAAGPEDILARLDRMLTEQIELMTALAARGEDTYRRMIDLGRDADLAAAQRQIRSWSAISGAG